MKTEYIILMRGKKHSIYEKVHQAYRNFIRLKDQKMCLTEAIWLVVEQNDKWEGNLYTWNVQDPDATPPYYTQKASTSKDTPDLDHYPGLDSIDRWIIRNVPPRPAKNPYKSREMSLKAARKIVEALEARTDSAPLTPDERRAIALVNEDLAKKAGKR